MPGTEMHHDDMETVDALPPAVKGDAEAKVGPNDLKAVEEKIFNMLDGQA